MLILHFRKKRYQSLLPLIQVKRSCSHEMNKQLDILLIGSGKKSREKKTNDYNRMMSAIDENIRKVRNVGNKGETAGEAIYFASRYEYEYYKILRKYLPSLLEQEQF